MAASTPGMEAEPASDPPHFKLVAIIGIGLIGSSVALAVKRHNLADEVVCNDINPAYRDTAQALGLVSRACATPEEAVEGADLVIFCSPVGSYGGLAEAIAGALAPGCILADVG